MKYFSAVLVFITCISFAAAQSAADVFASRQGITWLGLDFTALQLAGDEEAWKDAAHVHEVITSINNLMISEKAKYDVAGAMRKPAMDYQVEVTLTHNNKLNLDNVLSADARASLSRDDIQAIVETYDFTGLKGIGMMINIETLNKNTAQGSLWVTFINLDTKEVLFTEKLVEPPSGFGLRNYWASTVSRAIKEMKASEYQRWRQKYNRKNIQ